MKFILLLSILIAFNIEAAQNTWDKLQTGERYELSQKLSFKIKDKIFHIEKGTKLKLVESTPLNMIKVHLQRYEFDGCKTKELESDLELISIKGIKETAVGVNISKNCILEVFVEKKDFKKKSLLL